MRFMAVVPAAGTSRRMGVPKLLLPWQGKTVIERVLTAWHQSGASPIVVVVRADDEPLAKLCQRPGVVVARPAIAPPDMKSSVGFALASLEQQFAPTDEDAWMLAPADLPTLDAESIQAVMRAHDSTRPSILVPMYGGQRGHPVLFPWSCAVQVARLAESEGINGLLQRNSVREIALPRNADFEDLDTPEDYERLQRG